MVIDKLIHISDIHIRLHNRHNEYNVIFDKLYNFISNQTGNNVTVLTGDILHSKLDISSELISITYDFLYKLSRLQPLVVIPGNHDLNEKNMGRDNPLSVIINAINDSTDTHIHYLFGNENLVIDNINFCHIPFYDKTHIDYIDDSKINVGLYHGDISGCVYDTGEPSRSNVKIDIFSKYDCVLLGDIHKRQILDNNIAYAGSLIQQNFSESCGDHGGLIWDLVGMQIVPFDITNDYGFYTVDVNNIVLDGIKPNYKVRIPHTTSNIANAIEVRDTLSMMGVDIGSVELINSDNSKLIVSDRIQSNNMLDVDYQCNVIREMLSNKDNITDSDIDSIVDLHIDNYKMDNVDISVRNISISKLWFDNMFSYGKDNYIDFSSYTPGILGIIGENQTGKSSILDIITFAIFDTTRRTTKSADVMNISSDEMFVKIEIVINDELFYIERYGSRSKNGTVSVKVDFYTLQDKLNGDKRSSTNKIIQSYIGNIDDFLMTTFLSQDNGFKFSKLTQSEKKDLLIKYLNIDIFEDIKSSVDDEVKRFSNLLNVHKNIDINFEINNSKLNIEAHTSELEVQKNNIHNINHNIDELVNDISIQKSNITDITTVDMSVSDIDSLIETNNDLLGSIDIDGCNESIELYNNKIKSIKLDMGELLETYNNSIEFIKSNSNLKLDIQSNKQIVISKKQLIKSYTSEIDKFSDYDYDPECSHCVNNNKLYFDNIETKRTLITKLESEIEVLENKLLVGEGLLVEYDLHMTIIDNYNEKKSEVELYKDKLISSTDKLSKLKLEVDKLTSKLNELQQDKNTIINNKDIIDNNNIIMSRIENTNIKIKSYKDERDEIDNIISKLNLDIYKENDNIDRLTNIQIEISDLSKKHHIYKSYSELLSRNGIQLYILNTMIDIINIETNNIIHGMVDFNIKMVLNGSNIDHYIEHNGTYRDSRLASGMESFIIDIATRVALYRISSYISIDFLMIDEGFGALDVNNLSKIPDVFDMLREYYSNIVVISHIDSIKDYMDNYLHIINDGVSRITF